MSALAISFSVVALIASIAALVTASKAKHQTLDHKPAEVAAAAREQLPELPTTTHRWSLSEEDGTWTWCVWGLHHSYELSDGYIWGRWTTPTVKTEEGDAPLASGFTDTRKDAEKAIQRWFWREFKGRQTPQFDQFRLGGTWTVKS